MAANEILERFSKEVMSEAFKASAGSEGETGLGLGDAFINIGETPDCPRFQKVSQNPIFSGGVGQISEKPPTNFHF